MASKVDTCNAALSHIGSDAIVSSIDPPDGSVEAGHCARFYRMSLLELLDSHPWTFAKKRVLLAEVTNASAVWAHAYALPSDCLSPVRVLQKYQLESFGYWPFGSLYASVDELALYTERGSAEFEIESGVLYTHEPDAVLLYTYEAIDPSKYPPLFNTAHSYLLASYLAGPLVKGDAGARASSTFRLAVFGQDGKGGLAGKSLASDSNQSAERSEHVPDHIRIRS